MFKKILLTACCIIFSHCIAGLSSSLNKTRISQYNRKYQRDFQLKNLEKVKYENSQKELYLSQILDHFNSSDNTTWMQRYFINSQFFKLNGPVFLYIEGEAEAQYNRIKYGALVEYARRFSALIVSLEHRFYGQSLPFENLTVENLKYLNIQQAVEDASTFSEFIISDFNLTESNQWIAFGGSYAGTIAAFLRLKYPKLIAGAVASSAPMIALVNFKQYMEVVQSSLNYFSPNCSFQISEAINIMQDFVKTSVGLQFLENLFNICDHIESDEDMSSFFFQIATVISEIVQYNNINLNQLSIIGICNIMTNESTIDPLSKLAFIINKYNNIDPNDHQTCLEISYNNSINFLKNSLNEPSQTRQWVWQLCTQFGWFLSSDSSDQPFGPTFPLEYWTNQCVDIFGPEFNSTSIDLAVFNTNIFSGIFNNDQTNTVFVNGRIDPWHSVSLFNQNSNNQSKINTIIMNATAHCQDLSPSMATDPPELKQARLTIISLINDYLAPNGLINQNYALSSKPFLKLILFLILILFYSFN